MRRQHNELTIGVSVTVATLVVILGVLFLQRPAFLSHGFVVYMSVQNADNLGKGDAVTFRGVRVGSINNIAFKDDHLVLDLEINSGMHIPEDSQFVIQSGGILSGNTVAILPGKSKRYIKSGAKVHGSTSPGFAGLLSGGTGIEQQVQDILTSLKKFPDNQVQQQVAGLLENLLVASKDLRSTLDENSARISSIFKDVDQVTSRNQDDITSTIHSLKSGAAQLESTLADTQRAIDRTTDVATQLEDLLRNLRGGKGTFGQLLNNDEVYVKLNSTLDNINALVTDIRKNPGRYISVHVF